MSSVIAIEYQDLWPTQFHEAAAELEAALSDPSSRIEHVGSTSVPGLCAKPVIDIVLGAQRLSDIDSHALAIAELGYVYRPDYEAEMPERTPAVQEAGSGLTVKSFSGPALAAFCRDMAPIL